MQYFNQSDGTQKAIDKARRSQTRYTKPGTTLFDVTPPSGPKVIQPSPKPLLSGDKKQQSNIPPVGSSGKTQSQQPKSEEQPKTTVQPSTTPKPEPGDGQSTSTTPLQPPPKPADILKDLNKPNVDEFKTQKPPDTQKDSQKQTPQKPPSDDSAPNIQLPTDSGDGSSQVTDANKQESKSQAPIGGFLYHWFYRKERTFANFRITDYVSLPDLPQQLRANSFQGDLERDINEIYSCLSAFGGDADPLAVLKSVLQLSILCDPYVLLNIIGASMGSEPALPKFSGQDMIKFGITYAYTLLKPSIINRVTELFSGYKIGDNVTIVINGRSGTMTQHKSLYETRANIKVNSNKIEGNTFTKQSWWVKIKDDFTSIVNSTLDTTRNSGLNEIIKKHKNIRMDWCENSKYRAIADVVIGRIYDLNTNPMINKRDITSSNIASTEIAENQYGSVESRLISEQNAQVVTQYIRFKSFIDRLFMAIVWENGKLFGKFKLDFFTLCSDIILKTLLVAPEFIPILLEFTKLCGKTEDGVASVPPITFVEEYDKLVTIFMGLGMRSVHDISGLYSNGSYNDITTLLSVIISFVYGNSSSIFVKYTKYAKEFRIHYLSIIKYIPVENTHTPLEEIADRLFKSNPVGSNLGNYSANISKYILELKDYKPKPLISLRTTNKEVDMAIGGIVKMIDNLKWIEYSINGVVSDLREYITTHFPDISTTRQDVFRNITLIHGPPNSEPAKYDLTLDELAEQIGELSKTLQKLNRIAPKAHLTKIERANFKHTTTGLYRAIMQIILNENPIPNDSFGFGVFRDKVKDVLGTLGTLDYTDSVKFGAMENFPKSIGLQPVVGLGEVMEPNNVERKGVSEINELDGTKLEGSDYIQDKRRWPIQYEKFGEIYATVAYLVYYINIKWKVVFQKWWDIERPIERIVGINPRRDSMLKFIAEIRKSLYSLSIHMDKLDVKIYADAWPDKQFYINTQDSVIREMVPFLPYMYIKELPPKEDDKTKDFWQTTRRKQFVDGPSPQEKMDEPTQPPTKKPKLNQYSWTETTPAPQTTKLDQ
jgi:hypothetical protein